MAQKKYHRGRRKKRSKKKIGIIIWIVFVVMIFLIAGGYAISDVMNRKSEVAGENVENFTKEKDFSGLFAIVEEKAVEIQKLEKMKRLVVIDAGHQQRGNSSHEPIGPGAYSTKPKVASGTAGVATGAPEYKVTLEVSKKLQKELEERGYRVIMVRTENDVNISNAERAEVANRENADAFVRIHCNGSENSSANGAMTICMTKNNPYCSNIYNDSKTLSDKVLEELCSATGARKEHVWETDTMSGINWCKVPVTIVEMGYMTNPAEDKKLSDEAYQEKLAKGIANGIEEYFKTKE